MHDHDDDAPTVRGGLLLLIDDEPPFGTANAAAIDDAMRRGRRRRLARAVAGGTGVAALVAAAAVGVVTLRPQVVELALQPAAPPPPAPSGLPDHDELVPVVQAVAASAEASAEVTVLPELYYGSESVAAVVAIETDAGVVEASVSVHSPGSGSDLELHDESCEGRRCEQLFRGETEGAWAFYGTQVGREKLDYAIEAQYGVVSVVVDNYTAQGEGTKVVGPSWSDVGFEAEAIREVVADSGLLDWSPDD